MSKEKSWLGWVYIGTYSLENAFMADKNGELTCCLYMGTKKGKMWKTPHLITVRELTLQEAKYFQEHEELPK